MHHLVLNFNIWSGPDLKHSGAQVAWHAVCAPIEEAGLGPWTFENLEQGISIIRHLWVVYLKADTL